MGTHHHLLKTASVGLPEMLLWNRFQDHLSVR
jgi:hypothetical protein